MNPSLLGVVSPPDLHVMTFNVRRRLGRLTRTADRWEVRRPRVEALLRGESPTVLGVQEAMPSQAVVLRDALGRRYRLLGRGRRKDGRGEGCPLLYDADRLELIAWDQTALSDTPAVAGSTGWGNAVPRVLVSAEFRDVATSRRFLVLNTHLDPLSPRSRVRSASEIRRRVQCQSLPAIVLGDLNARPGSPTLRHLLTVGGLRDGWTTARVRTTPEYDTFAGYRPPRQRGRRIDWIAVTTSVDVLRAGIDARPVDGGWPSDHLPVGAVVRMGAER